MKFSDYRRLGKISIKARKKSTKHTVTGICFGLIMLIPIIYFTLGFYLGMTDQLDKTATTSVFLFPSRNVYDGGAQIVDDSEWGGNFAVLDYKTGQKLANDKRVEEYVAAEWFRVSGMGKYNYGNTATTLKIDGQDYSVRTANTGGKFEQYIPVDIMKIVNTYVNDTVFLDAEKKDLAAMGASVFTHGEGFTGEGETYGKGQILVSEHLLEKCGVPLGNPDSLIGKKLSAVTRLNNLTQMDVTPLWILERDESADELPSEIIQIPWLTDFVIAGILSDAYYTLPSNTQEAHMIFTAPSFYTPETYNAFAPEFTVETEEQADGRSSAQAFARYPDGISALCSAAAAEERGVLAYGALRPQTAEGMYINDVRYDSMPAADIVTTLLSFKTSCGSYKAASVYAKTLDGAFAGIRPAVADDPFGGAQYANSVYTNFLMISNVGNYLMLVLYAFGGIIFFATMLNLYNSVNYSVQARRNYIGVMRAIGAKQKTVPRMYFFEILLIFARALPWVLIFSAGISFGIMTGVNKLFEAVGEAFGGAFKMAFSWYFVTLGVVLVVVFAIAVAFSQIACRSVAHRPILDVLSDDKG